MNPADASPVDPSEPRWHAMAPGEVCEALHVDPALGLSAKVAAQRRAQGGTNALVAGHRTPWWRILARQFTDVLIAILVVAAVVSAATGEGTDAIAILSIVVLNGLLGFVQEVRAEHALAALAQMLQPRAQVLRDSQLRELDAAELVPGDIVQLATGDRVPADVRVLTAHHLQVDESALTGESQTVDKDPAHVAPTTALAERSSVALMGTAITHGHGTGVVIAIGMATELGRVARLTSEVDRTPTPLQRRLAQLGRQLGALSLVTAALVGVIGWLTGKPALEMFVTGIALAVAVVPEGLPAVVTITLVLGIRHMLARKALIRRLQAAETLGCATIICSDKTGTLTENQMTVTSIWLPSGAVEVGGTGYAPMGTFTVEGEVVAPRPDVLRLLHTGQRCNHARIHEDDGAWHIVGEPTEAALVVAAAKAGLPGPDRSEPLAEHAFDAVRKRMSVVVEDGAERVVHTKGAPEHVLACCTAIADAGGTRPLDATERQVVLDQVDALAARGLRTLAMATRTLPADVTADDEATVERELVLLGIVGMLDPPRAAVPDALRLAATAGVRTMMITGDAPATALAIARQVGLPAERAVTGPELDLLSDDALIDLLAQPVLFARTTPEHKLRLVHALQSQGEVVAMTGDGVNDAPALKAADIGVAMGLRGTEVARGAADMILTDDNYASIVGAIEEGRRQYDNIVKFVRYLLTSNTGEVLALLGGIILGGPLLLLPVQILWMNLITDGVTAVALGLEPAEPGVMRHDPRSADAAILDRRAGLQIGLLGSYVAAATLGLFLWDFDGANLDHARTLAFTALVIVEKVNVFGFRSLTWPLHRIGLLSNPWLVAAWVSMVGLQVAAVYVPVLQGLLSTVPLTAQDWALVAAAALPVLVVPEAIKLWRTRGR